MTYIFIFFTDGEATIPEVALEPIEPIPEEVENPPDITEKTSPSGVEPITPGKLNDSYFLK